MNKRILYIIAALVLGVISITMIFSFIREKEEQIKKLLSQRNVKEVVIAKVNIPKGKRISPKMLTTKRVPENKVEAGAFSYIEAVIGKIAKTTIYKNQQITSSIVSYPKELERLSSKTPTGKRALTISVDRISSLDSGVKSGDHIDIIGIFPFSQEVEGKTLTQNVVVPMFEDVLVLKAGEGSKGRISTLTLALEPEEARLLTYALEVGKIKILLRSSLDTKKSTVKEPITMDKLWEKLLGLKKVPSPSSPPPPPRTVEVYKGVEKKSVIVEEE